MATASLNESVPSSNPVLSVECLPLFIYRNQPVVTSAVLADLYGTEPKRIRENFRLNSDRFTEGKHFFKVEGKEYKELREYARNSGSLGIGAYLPRGGSALMLWTARGSGRHAKMLNTDKAWDVFESMEENYFSRRQAQDVPSPSRLTTAKERNALATLVNRYVGMLPGGPNQEAYKSTWRKVHDVMGIKAIEELTVGQLPRAVVFVQTLVDAMALPAGEAPKALPAAAKPLSTIRDYASVFRGLPDKMDYWSNLSRRLVRAHDVFQAEMEAIKKDALRPFRENRRIEIETFLDSATVAIYKKLFEISEDEAHTAYRGAYGALLGLEGLHDLLVRG